MLRDARILAIDASTVAHRPIGGTPPMRKPHSFLGGALHAALAEPTHLGDRQRWAHGASNAPLATTGLVGSCCYARLPVAELSRGGGFLSGHAGGSGGDALRLVLSRLLRSAGKVGSLHGRVRENVINLPDGGKKKMNTECVKAAQAKQKNVPTQVPARTGGQAEGRADGKAGLW